MTYARLMAKFPAKSPASESTVGARIRAARAARGLTQEGLAAAVGVSRSAVAQWETERAGQIRGNLGRIAAVLETPVEYLLFGADKRAPAQATSADELALLRLYRELPPEDRAMLLQTARRLARES